MEVSNRVQTFELDWTEGEPLGVHVVKIDDTAILFGAGDESTSEQLLDIAERNDVEIVIIEHGDVDHYEGAPFLREELDVEIAVPSGDAEFLREAGIDPDYELNSGETYWGIQTISVPGHTPDNTAYLFENVLIAGDTVAGADSVFAEDRVWEGDLAVITPDFNANYEQMKTSVSKLLEYDYETVLVSHGSNVLSNGHEEVEILNSQLN